MVYSYVAIVAM